MNVAEQIGDARHGQARDTGQRFHARRTVIPPKTRPGLGYCRTEPRPLFHGSTPHLSTSCFLKYWHLPSQILLDRHRTCTALRHIAI